MSPRDSIGELSGLLHSGIKLIVNSSLYTQAWDASYATNKGQWRGTAHYTIQQSVAAVNATNSGDVRCPSDVAYLSATGAAFCSAYLAYAPPVSTVVTVTTPATSVVTSVETDYTTETYYTTSYSTDVSVLTTTMTAMQKRALQTPASASTWSPSRLSKACSAVATGSTTTTSTQTAATPLSTLITTQKEIIASTVSTGVIISSTSTTSLLSIPKTTSLGSNLVVNPSFEQGSGPGTIEAPTAWTVSDSHTYRTINAAGAYDSSAYVYVLRVRSYRFICVLILSSYFGIPKTGSTDVLSQTITGLSLSDQYTLTFYYYHKIGTVKACSLVTSFGGVVVTAINPVISNNAYEYHEISVAGISPLAASQDLSFAFSCGSSITGNFLILDEVSFQIQS